VKKLVLPISVSSFLTVGPSVNANPPFAPPRDFAERRWEPDGEEAHGQETIDRGYHLACEVEALNNQRPEEIKSNAMKSGGTRFAGGLSPSSHKLKTPFPVKGNIELH
jgi:hypothetical protein